MSAASSDQTAAVRLVASWLLTYPDDRLTERLPEISATLDELPAAAAAPLRRFVTWLASQDPAEAQRLYVDTFDFKRKTAPYLTFWTDGDTRNRGYALVRFKQAYREAGMWIGDDELPDHLAVVLEFAATGDRLTGDALLVEHRVGIGLLREALTASESPYASVLEAVHATLPPMTDEISRRIAELARMGPPVESVGLEPFSLPLSPDLGGVRA